MDYATFFEWSGCFAGLLGAFLLATNTAISRYGWVAFAVANVAMIAMAIMNDLHGLLLQQLGFMATSALGLYRAGFFRHASHGSARAIAATGVAGKTRD